MARCGCSTSCGCALAAQQPNGAITISGNGSAGSPYTIGVVVSADQPNLLLNGTDGGLLVPPTALDAGNAITITGTGTTDDPYVISTSNQTGDTAIAAGDNITVTGAGTSADPYIISSASSTTVSAGDGITVTGDGSAFEVSANPSYASYHNTAFTPITTAGVVIPLSVAATATVAADYTLAGGVVTVVRAGVYKISVQAVLNCTQASSATAQVGMRATLTGAGSLAAAAVMRLGSGMVDHSYSLILPLAAGTALSLTAFKTTSVTVGVVSQVYFGLERLGPQTVGGVIPVDGA